MLAVPNCYADVLRHTTENSDGDDESTPDAAPVYEKQPFSILETSKRVFTPATQQARTIRTIVARCRGDLVIQEDDQIWDRTRQRLYAVMSLSHDDGAPISGDWRLTLQRTTGGPSTP
jgi:hypothetical protein